MNPASATPAGSGLIRTTPLSNNVITGTTASPLSAEQLRIADALVRDVRRGKSIQTLGGYAGTGKTTTIRELRARLPGMAVCAFTGKAATMLRRKGIPASTIHATIYTPTGPATFRRRAKLPAATRGFIIDEASMVGETIYKDLLSFDRPVVFVGDHGQLEPVERGFNLMAAPDYTLEHVWRHAGEIPRFAEWLRLGRPARAFRPESDAVRLITKRELTGEMETASDQIICGYNRTRDRLNASVRESLGHSGTLVPGDRVMFLRNARQAGIFNGLQGTVVRVVSGRDQLRLDLDTYDGVRRGIAACHDPAGTFRRGVHAFDYAYAITCHKAQGDEWPRVLVIEERCQYWDHRRWTYTAASRTREQLTWVLG